MSGGVDSSVAAALLKEQGYDVTGVYMKNWSQDVGGFICSWQDDYQDAKRVAVQLGISFRLYDFRKEYRQAVVDYLIKEYQAGRTPNPDIMCNQEIKFKLFLKTALADGADYIATGHYVRRNGDKLLTGLDKTKDQSYFLYRIDHVALLRSLFPIGNYHKTKIRQLAKKYNLVTADKPDSQGICFVGEIGIKEFLTHELGPQQPGPILDQNGQEIGQHDGAIFYTIGQRRGLHIGGGLPYYVTKKEMSKNAVYVTTDLDDPNLWSNQVSLEQLHWINKVPKGTVNCQVRLRYRGPLVASQLKEGVLYLTEAQRGLAAGQSAVLYIGQEVLGGGIMGEIRASCNIEPQSS